MISFDGIEVSYGDKAVLTGMSFAARDGAVTGFVGPNGSGKSTAFKALLGLLEPIGGTAYVDGFPYRSLADPGGSVGAFLGSQWLPGAYTGKGYLTYMARLLRVPTERVDKYLDDVGLGGSANLCVRSYSLGMRQRLGIAGAFLGEPRNLLLDEPVNGLDVDGVRWIRHYLRMAADAGRCVLLSSHLLSELELVADDIVMLGAGKVTRSGTVNELKMATDGSVVVMAKEAQLLASHLVSQGANASIRDGAIIVTGQTVNWVARVASESGIALDSVSRNTNRLEDVYLEQVHHDQQVTVAGPIANTAGSNR